jgi:hypothetical protein
MDMPQDLLKFYTTWRKTQEEEGKIAPFCDQQNMRMFKFDYFRISVLIVSE